MPTRAAPTPRPTATAGRTLSALLTGAAAGLIVAAAALWSWTWLAPRGPATHVPERDLAGVVDVFRLPSGTGRDLVVVRAGPDAAGEPALSARLFPGETPPREFVCVVVSNAPGGDPWTLDLAAAPIRVRTGTGWEPLEPLASLATGLAPADEMRLRSLGGSTAAAEVGGGTMRQVLLALPRGRKMSDITGVQFQDASRVDAARPEAKNDPVNLIHDRFDLERLRRFRAEGRIEPLQTASGR